MADCLFCRIVEGTLPATILYQDDHAIAFRDLQPQAPVHALVIPRAHLRDVTELKGELAGRMMEAISAVAHQQGLAESGYRVVTNVGPDAQQSVFHLHWHVLGGRSLGWPPG